MSKPGHGPVLHPNSSPVSITKEAKAAAAASSSSYGGGAGVLSLTCAATTEDKAGETTFEGFDVVLSAIGRTPATKSLNLSAANVAVDKRGFIVVDEFENTSAKNKVHVYMRVCLEKLYFSLVLLANVMFPWCVD